MEANKVAWATTPHSCDPPNSVGYYEGCDKGGTCAANNRLNWIDQPDAYGPGYNYKINTNRPFHAKIDINEEGGEFSGF